MAQREPSLEGVQAEVDVLTLIVEELCLAMPSGGACNAMAAIRARLQELPDVAPSDEAEEADALRAAIVARILSALSLAAARPWSEASFAGAVLSRTEAATLRSVACASAPKP